jgi:hypothetical protein
MVHVLERIREIEDAMLQVMLSLITTYFLLFTLFFLLDGYEDKTYSKVFR